MAILCECEYAQAPFKSIQPTNQPKFLSTFVVCVNSIRIVSKL